MSDSTPVPLLGGLVFPEGPRWRDGKLWLSDQHAHRVLTVDLQGNTEQLATVDEIPSGLGFLPDGSLIIVSERDQRLLRWTPESLSLYADLSGLATGLLNDMVVDAQGRAYVGDDPIQVGAEITTGLVLVPPDGHPRQVAEGLHYPNGMVITPDGGTLIVAETFGAALTAFDIAENGDLSNQRTWATLAEGVLPDGICLDAEGAIWVASVFGGEFIRIQEGGAVLDRIAVPGRWAVACILGGEARTTLFLLLAETTLEDLAQGRSNGSIETVEVAVPGAGWPSGGREGAPWDSSARPLGTKSPPRRPGRGWIRRSP